MSSWRDLLLRIGDKSPEYGTSSDFKDHIETCFGVLRRELEHSEEEILNVLLDCAEQLPHKIPLFGTLIGLMNLENEDFVRKVVEKTQTNLQDGLDSGNCNRIRILMRFLTVLMCSKVIQPSSLVVVFETLLSSAATTVDEEKGNPSWQACADFYITCILSCLPWGGAELMEQVPEEIERVMVGVEAYLSIRKHASDTGLSFFEDDDETENGEKDFLEDLWSRVQDLSNNGWKLDSVPRPHLSFEAQLVAGKSHEFVPISCPEQHHSPSTLSVINHGQQKHEAELKYPQRIRRLNIFPASKAEDLQPIDRFVVEEYLLDVLFFFNGRFVNTLAGLEAAFSFLEFIQSQIPRGVGSDTSHWCLNENGKFDTRSYYNNIRGASASNFPWKGVWKVNIPKRVAISVWTAVHGQILTLDNLMLRGRILVNRCCMCYRNEETVDHLLLHCPVAHSLWVYMYQIFLGSNGSC